MFSVRFRTSSSTVINFSVDDRLEVRIVEEVSPTMNEVIGGTPELCGEGALLKAL